MLPIFFLYQTLVRRFCKLRHCFSWNNFSITNVRISKERIIEISENIKSRTDISEFSVSTRLFFKRNNRYYLWCTRWFFKFSALRCNVVMAGLMWNLKNHPNARKFLNNQHIMQLVRDVMMGLISVNIVKVLKPGKNGSRLEGRKNLGESLWLFGSRGVSKVFKFVEQ